MILHPSDGRYKVVALEPYLSEDAILKYILKVELAHLETLREIGICPSYAFETISARASEITAAMWNEKQKDPKYKHNIRALMALIDEPLPDEIKGYFHLGLTSYDAVDNAYVLILKDATKRVVLPKMISLGGTLLDKAKDYKSTVQVGRSHGQHGEPTTFGREIAWHADRWGKSIIHVNRATDEFEGKIGSAMGTKATLRLLYDPKVLEEKTLARLGLKPSRITTQIAQPEDAARYYAEIVIASGILSNLANDMRHLARTEIGEIALEAPEGHGKSSTMLHKGMSEHGVIIGNPEDFENVCGQHREIKPQIITVLDNQESEHNRDIRNSSAERYFKPQILIPFVYSIGRCVDAMKILRANTDVMRGRVENAWHLLMEPAYIALRLNGVPNAQEYVRSSVKTYGDFRTALVKDEKIRAAIIALPVEKRNIFDDTTKYIGNSEQQVDDVVEFWTNELFDINKKLKKAEDEERC